MHNTLVLLVDIKENQRKEQYYREHNMLLPSETAFYSESAAKQKVTDEYKKLMRQK